MPSLFALINLLTLLTWLMSIAGLLTLHLDALFRHPITSFTKLIYLTLSCRMPPAMLVAFALFHLALSWLLLDSSSLSP